MLEKGEKRWMREEEKKRGDGTRGPRVAAPLIDVAAYSANNRRDSMRERHEAILDENTTKGYRE